MKNRLRLFIIFYVFLGISTEKSIDYADTVIPSYRTRSLPDIVENPHTNWTTLTEALDIFSGRNLVKNWVEGRYPVGEQCSKDISRYIEGLKRQELWALKVDDASGRYTNGFFWGNSYFTGSATECQYIGQNYVRKNEKPTSTSTIDEVQEFNTEPHKKGNLGLSGTNLLTQTFIDQPPYPLAVLAKLAASDIAGKNSVIEKIRDQHNLYDMYSDPVYWILFGVTTVVLVLMIAGSGYDLYLTRMVARKKNMIYDLEKHGKLDQLSNGNPKTLNADTVPNGSTAVNNNNDHEGTLQSPNEGIYKLSVLEELLLSFSVPSNLKVICDSNVGGDTISTIHGLRAISMAWVILGHTCIVVFKYSDNMEYRKVVERKFLFQTITNGAFSVDTFFFMGGLLVSFLYFRTNAKGDLNKLTQGTKGFVAGSLKFIGLLVYRFCRLTAPYMFILGVVEISMKWFYFNSVFEPPTADHYNCPNYWWRNLLYINTLFPVDQMCMPWSWYVADDTQFYIVGGVILVLATNHFKIAASAVITLLVSSWLTTGYIALANNHMPSSDDPLALFDKIYDKPWTRLGPYLIGMSVGYFLFKTDCKVKMSKAIVVIGWLLSSACLLSLLYGLYEAELAPVTAAAYSSLSHSAWALGLAWIIIACSTGYGGYINKILSAPVLYPFSRVTYCAYLIHPIIIRLTAMNLDSPFHLGKDTVMITFLGQLILSYVLSFIVSVSFEAPVVSMLKILAPKKRKRIQ
ncbi:hypothetical protein HZH66_010819 [Vespula vulgaris]|uniref:Nose resistant to fluoxetine protein 6 n=1 Tax=Vespula vulgaris TaxID=7454 RepID=A0A834MWT2_VESVU|nr:hypothetical protein HZH66_010819 [Vespula vulgaris]